MAFNGWMEPVTGDGTDATMATALVEHRCMIEVYDRPLEDHAAFREQTGAFADMWSVLGQESDEEGDRSDLHSCRSLCIISRVGQIGNDELVRMGGR